MIETIGTCENASCITIIVVGNDLLLRRSGTGRTSREGTNAWYVSYHVDCFTLQLCRETLDSHAHSQRVC
jgi:hypothetical protein